MVLTDTPEMAAAAVDRGDALGATPGVTGTVAFVVTGGPDGESRFAVRVVDGRPVEVIGGAEADCTFTVPEPEALALVRGALEPSVAFMRGRLKTSGDNGLVLSVLAITAGEGFAPWLSGLSARPRTQ